MLRRAAATLRDRPIRFLLCAYLAVNLLDIWSTWLALRAGADETNPLFARVLVAHGYVAASVLKMALVLAGTFGALCLLGPDRYSRFLARATLLALVAVVAYAAGNNLALAHFGWR